jgi:2-oxoglutarate dehydrogenase complex dehydrogenase (E1) component-like enzyme
MQIVYFTEPANLFHALRRQMHRQFRKRKSSHPTLDVSCTNIF